MHTIRGRAEAWDSDVTVGVDCGVVGDIEAKGDQLFGRQRVPVPNGAAKVLLRVVVMTPLGQPHRRNVLVHVDGLADTGG